MRATLFVLLVGVAVAACSPIEPPPQTSFRGVRLAPVAEGLEEPAGLVSPPGDDRLFVIERAGRIRVIENGRLLDEPALDLTGEVNAVGEKGMTGLAFHPDFRSNQKAYVMYNELDGNSMLVEYRVGGPNRRTFEPASARLVLELEQSDFFHQAGYLLFGPDGYLWVTFGDGDSQADRFGRGQDPTSLYASVLRIDVDSATPYGIPASNPFADGRGGAPEVWAYGFRNPWRIAFDEQGGVMFIADVGQWSWEEIDIVSLDEPGRDFGWSILEGNSCFGASDCEEAAAAAGLAGPALVYGHDEGCAIIGGPVYEGSAIPELRGQYFYGDHCVGWIRSLQVEGERILDRIDWSDQLGTVPSLMSFGTDSDGEVYVLQRDGHVYRIDAVRDDVVEGPVAP